MNRMNLPNGCPAAEINNYHSANSFNTIAKSPTEMAALAIFLACVYTKLLDNNDNTTYLKKDGESS